jgi:hypothetical protein
MFLLLPVAPSSAAVSGGRRRRSRDLLVSVHAAPGELLVRSQCYGRKLIKFLFCLAAWRGVHVTRNSDKASARAARVPCPVVPSMTLKLLRRVCRRRRGGRCDSSEGQSKRGPQTQRVSAGELLGARSTFHLSSQVQPRRPPDPEIGSTSPPAPLISVPPALAALLPALELDGQTQIGRVGTDTSSPTPSSLPRLHPSSSNPANQSRRQSFASPPIQSTRSYVTHT